jgi:DNA-binding MarR family transcriptional regulator
MPLRPAEDSRSSASDRPGPSRSHQEQDVKQIPGDAGLGTLLRHLVELLDGDVEAVYREERLDCRSRFTPIIRHLEREGPSTIRQIADSSGLSHSAISQSLSEMLKKGLVASATGEDARERIISLTTQGEALLPRLHQLWSGIWAAADELSAEIDAPLADVLKRAIDAVERRPFRDRIKAQVECMASPAREEIEA